MRLPSEPFVVEYLERAFRVLNTYGSIFELILRARRRRGVDPDKHAVAALTECWIVLNFVFAWVAIFIARPLIEWQQSPSWSRTAIWLLFVCYPAVRVVEVVVFQIWTQILGGYRNKAPRMIYVVVGLRRSVVLAGLLYLEAIVWFGVMYEALAENFANEVVRHWYGALYYSAVTMTTTGFGDITPNTFSTYLLTTFQILIGWAMIVMIISRVVAYLPRPSSRDPVDEPEAVDGLTLATTDAPHTARR